MKNADSKALAWHYTTGEKAKLIAISGCIEPATTYVPPSERPIVWFSTNPYFEQTACKAWEQNGVIRRLTMAQMAERCDGLVRFAVYRETLIRWSQLKGKAHMASATIKGLEQVAVAQRAFPNQWFGSFEPVPLSAVVSIERMIGETWRAVTDKLNP